MADRIMLRPALLQDLEAAFVRVPPGEAEEDHVVRQVRGILLYGRIM